MLFRLQNKKKINIAVAVRSESIILLGLIFRRTEIWLSFIIAGNLLFLKLT